MNKIKNLPERIYLNLGDGCLDDTDFHALSEVTWSEDKATDNDIEYIRKSEWVSVEERLPPSTCLLMCINAREDKAYALCVYIRGRFMIYDHTLSYKREFYPTHWLKVPQLNPEKQSI